MDEANFIKRHTVKAVYIITVSHDRGTKRDAEREVRSWMNRESKRLTAGVSEALGPFALDLKSRYVDKD